MRLSLQDAIQRYGAIENGIWRDEAKWCYKYVLPEEISSRLINSATGKATSHIYCNQDMVKALDTVLTLILAAGLEMALETFDGCYMVRDVRGLPGHPSAHSYALAIDLNASTNKLGCQPTLDPRVIALFKAQGFAWGGDFKRLDGMHFSFCWE